MSSIIGSGVIEVSADSRKLTAGIDEAKKSLKSLGIAAGDATKGQSQSIDRYVKSLGTVAVTAGKSGRELELYKLALRGATAEQLKAADSALRMSDAYARGEQIGQRMRTGMIALGAAATLAAGAWTSMIISSINAADNLNDLSKKTGVSVEDLSGLGLAAKQSGTDLEGLAASISKLSVNMGKDPEKYRALGISAKDPIEAFKQLADIFAAIEDPQTRAALGAEALGKSWQSAAPVLAEGSKSIGEMIEKGKRLSGVTTEMAQEADRFNDQLEEMKAAASGLGMKMAGEMLPAFTNITNAIKTAYEESGKLSALWVAMGSIGAFLFTDEFASNTVKLQGVNKELELIHKKQEAIAKSGSFVRSLYGSDSLDAKEKALQTRKASIENDMKPKLKQASITPPTPPDLKGKIASFVGSDAKGKNAAGKSSTKAETEAARELKKAYDDLMKVAQARADLRNSEYKSINDYMAAEEAARVATVQAANEAVRTAQDEYDNYGKTKSQIAEVTLARLNDRLQAVRSGSIVAASIEAEIEAQKRLIEIMKKGEGRDIADKALEDQKKVSADYAQGLHDDVKNALSTAFRDTKDPIKAFGDALGNVIFTRVTSSIADAMATQILDSGIAKGFMAMFGFKDGGAFNSGGVQAFASGGAFTNQIVNKATPFKFASGGSFRNGVMGEAGPEAVMPLTRGPDGKLGVQASGGQAITVIQNFTVGDVASVSMVRQAVAGSEKRIAAGLGRSMSYGGALA